MAFELPELPYDSKALEPHLTANLLSFHHGKHHATYFAKLNPLVEGTDFAKMSLEEVVKKSASDPKHKKIFNNAAQAWNHTFYWHSMKPGGGGKPTGAVADKIESDLGGYDKFKEVFSEKASLHFGSGWAWLVLNKEGKLEVVDTHDADTPVAHGAKPLITIDVWEHAYYIDYQNRRPDYVKVFLENLVSWDFANQNLD